MVSLALTGDVMLGRLVDRYVLGDPAADPAYVWGDTGALFAQADLRLINLECVIVADCQVRPAAHKAFTFCARPRAIEALRAVQVDCVALANNHVLDFGSDALLEMLDRLDQQRIARAGAGRTLEEAVRPAVLSAGDLTVGVIGITDNEPDWEAGATRPGTSYVDYDIDGLTAPYLDRLRRTLAATKQRTDLAIVSAHVGPNWGEPSPAMQALARQVIDLGADLYWGHSNHATRGVEIYHGRPILYSTGDFVDDYAVDPDERNDLSFLFQVMVEGKCLHRLLLHPVKIGHLQVNRATGDDTARVKAWMRARCARFGTPLTEEGEALQIDLSA